MTDEISPRDGNFIESIISVAQEVAYKLDNGKTCCKVRDSPKISESRNKLTLTQ